ncbi:MAG: hypothetical protein AAGK00_11315 [Pseudomonadota bacterium]
MDISPPDLSKNADRHLRFVGLMGLLRVRMFEGFGERKYWNEHYADLFMSMLAKQLRGRVSTLEELTNSMSNISHSTKLRLIEEARRDGLIEVVNRSQVKLQEPLDTLGARKVFFLSESATSRLCTALDEMASDVEAFALARKGETA